ncbi:DMT family transporter [Pseudaminobacter sp. 19-2017]|uniref:DMT family transporter n=1 Tax=Pseudaminobacter soli (ex Zhang et al. 2022) TaxID=2831468 RepID=A0A942DWB7_9HYPH|nr:DMT family transporter [Pseudaminobacter soli]MBS3648449.1 DMT family transporter [Pseudaminobacter soli]
MAVQSPAIDIGVKQRDERLGLLLVFLSAFVWSTGGAIARFLEVDDSWTVVFWRSLFAAFFLVGFLLVRDGPRGTALQFRAMGVPGVIVGLCFASASTCFVLAIAYTTVANVMLINAGVPLLAALLGWILFRESVSRTTWAAIAAVLAGVAIMVSGSFGGIVSPLGDMLAVTIACSFAVATVVTRRYSEVRMTSAVCFGTIAACLVAFMLSGPLAVGLVDVGLLFAFGALNLGLGMALFASGARLVPASIAALLGTFETIAGPVWVWLIHGEVPSLRTIVGGTVVFAALLVHIGMQFARKPRPSRPGVTGIPSPH